MYPFLSSSYLLCDPKVSLWASIYLPSCQRPRSTCETFLEPTSLLLLLTLLLPLPHSKSSIPLLLFLLLSYFLPLVFSFISSVSPLTFSLLFSFFFLSFVFSILLFFALVSTAFHILLGTLSSSLLPFSSQSQDCGEKAMVFLRLHFLLVLSC